MNIMIMILATCCTTIEQPQCANIEQSQCILTFENKAVVVSTESDLTELAVLSFPQSEHSIAKQIWWNVIKMYIPPLPRPKS